MLRSALSSEALRAPPAGAAAAVATRCGLGRDTQPRTAVIATSTVSDHKQPAPPVEKIETRDQTGVGSVRRRRRRRRRKASCPGDATNSFGGRIEHEHRSGEDSRETKQCCCARSRLQACPLQPTSLETPLLSVVLDSWPVFRCLIARGRLYIQCTAEAKFKLERQ